MSSSELSGTLLTPICSLFYTISFWKWPSFEILDIFWEFEHFTIQHPREFWRMRSFLVTSFRYAEKAILHLETGRLHVFSGCNRFIELSESTWIQRSYWNSLIWKSSTSNTLSISICKSFSNMLYKPISALLGEIHSSQNLKLESS